MVFIASEFLLGRRGKREIILAAAGLFLTVADMGVHASLLMDHYHLENAASFAEYTLAQEAQLDEICARDDSVYRISQTSNRGGSFKTVNMNEGLCYGYMSISGYLSTTDERQLRLLQSLGYKTEANSRNVVQHSILASDSLLGVKYVLSPGPVDGLLKLEDYGTYNGKDTYQNPYALPFAFRFRKGKPVAPSKYEFLFTNDLYSELYGERVPLYQFVEARTAESENTITYTLDLPEGNFVFYGTIPTPWDIEAELSVNGEYTIPYSCHASPSLFSIPVKPGACEAVVTLSSGNVGFVNRQDVVFVALDLDLLEKISREIGERAADVISLGKKSVHIEVDHAEAGESLFVSLPYDEGLRVYRNGEQINVDVEGGCLYAISLLPGKNVIEIKYFPPFGVLGLLISALGLAGLILCSSQRIRGGRCSALKLESNYTPSDKTGKCETS